MNNPEFRQTLHNISHNLETANQAAQENIYTFTQLYIDPCLEGVKSGIYPCIAPCFTDREEHFRRKRGRSRGRAEYNFDFYNAWDDEEALGDSALGWGNDELDSLLAGRGAQSLQPRKQRAMSYGSKSRRNPSGTQQEPEPDPTVIPGSSYLGFLERLPWGIGTRTLRYHPSAADLQENPSGSRWRGSEGEPLLEEPEDEEEARRWRKSHGRQRSDTTTSRSTTNSLSSRGDLIMSDEDEYEDAQPLDDSFAVMLSRRNTNQGSAEDQNSSKSRTPNAKRPGISGNSTRTASSRSLKSPSSKGTQRAASLKSLPPLPATEAGDESSPPTLVELQREEENMAQAEELEIKQKRQAAQRLALERGLSSYEVNTSTSKEVKPKDAVEVEAVPTTVINTNEPDARLTQPSPAEPDQRPLSTNEGDDGKEPT